MIVAYATQGQPKRCCGTSKARDEITTMFKHIAADVFTATNHYQPPRPPRRADSSPTPVPLPVDACARALSVVPAERLGGHVPCGRARQCPSDPDDGAVRRAICAALALALVLVTPACGDPALDALVAACPSAGSARALAARLAPTTSASSTGQERARTRRLGSPEVLVRLASSLKNTRQAVAWSRNRTCPSGRVLSVRPEAAVTPATPVQDRLFRRVGVVIAVNRERATAGCSRRFIHSPIHTRHIEISRPNRFLEFGTNRAVF
jgi:hypothetical protein